jgi:hypothetical protein
VAFFAASLFLVWALAARRPFDLTMDSQKVTWPSVAPWRTPRALSWSEPSNQPSGRSSGVQHDAGPSGAACMVVSAGHVATGGDSHRDHPTNPSRAGWITRMPLQPSRKSNNLGDHPAGFGGVACPTPRASA